MIRGTHRLSLALLLGSFAAVGMAQPPVAPPPREVPSRAELIVGDWIMTKMDGRAASKAFDFVKSFSRDGTFKTYVRGKNGQIDKVSIGRYRVNDDSIELIYGPQGNGMGLRVPIVQITKTELVLHVPFIDEISRVDFVREKAK